MIGWTDSPIQTGIGHPPTSINHNFATAGNYAPLMTIYASDGLIDFDDAPLSVVAAALSDEGQFQTACYSCLEFKVVVPSGDTYTLDVTSQFESVGTWGTGFCYSVEALLESVQILSGKF